MSVTAHVVEPVDFVRSTYQHTITGLGVGQISEKLGFPPNVQDDIDVVENSWSFTVDSVPCAVWDYAKSYRMRRFSAFGPVDKLIAVFGAEHVEIN